MPLPEEYTLADVNEAIKEAAINTDNNIIKQYFTSELADIAAEALLMPLDIKKNIDEIDNISKEVVL